MCKDTTETRGLAFVLGDDFLWSRRTGALYCLGTMGFLFCSLSEFDDLALLMVLAKEDSADLARERWMI